MIVRCVDSLFQTDVLVEGGEYEVRFSKRRFEIVPRPTIEFSGRVAAA
jgi:hypothetical protein